jgi:hypothetical protein
MWKDGLCRAPNDLPGAFYRVHGKGLSLPQGRLQKFEARVRNANQGPLILK